MACGSERKSPANTITQKVCAQRYGNISACLLIQATLLRTASLYFHLHKCFIKDYEHLFDIPNSDRIGNDAWSLSPIHVISYKTI